MPFSTRPITTFDNRPGIARRLALLLDAQPVDYLHLARLAARLAQAPIAVIVLVDGSHLRYLSAIGLDERVDGASGAVADDPFCARIVATAAAHAVADALLDPRLRDSAAVSAGRLVAYAGVPLSIAGDTIGALWVADRRRRAWEPDLLEALADLGATIEQDLALREREARYRAIVEDQTDLLYRYQPDGTLSFANPAYCRSLGATCEQLLGTNLRDWLDADECAAFTEQLATLLRTREAVISEQHSTQPGDDGCWRQWIHQPILDPAGQIVEIQAVGREITARKRTEAALRASEERFRTLSACSPVGIFLADIDGHCIYSNPRLQMIAALSDEELLGLSWRQRIHPDDLQRVYDEWIDSARAGHELLNEYRLLLPDGTVRWVRSRNAPLIDSAGMLLGHVGTIEDITERRAIEEDLRRSEELFRLAVDCIPSMLAIYDADLRVRFVNKFGVALSGRAEHELLGRRDEELFPPEITDAYLPLLHRAAATHTIQSGEFTVALPLGSFIFNGTYVPVLDQSGQLRQILGITFDLTERTRAEQERLALERKLLETQKLESLGVLAGGIAHDFNNLLGAILGNSQLALLDLPRHAPARESLQQIELAAQRAADLTRQMLAYSGRGRFVVQPVDLNALIREMHQLLSASLLKTAQVEFHLMPGLPLLEADATQIRQVVMNLLTNAAEALGDSSGRIVVTTALIDADAETLAATDLTTDLPTGQYLALSVGDTGCGMDQATIARIFDPFFTTKFTGRGLGLAAVQGIVRGHHGTLKVQSAPGQGTVFTILLPPSSTRAEAAPPPEQPAPLTVTPGTILVVDDEPPVRMAVAQSLERLGFKVLLAADGRSGVELFRAAAHRIQCVLLDLTMPQMNGAQAFQALRAMQPRVPIIVMSGYEEQEVRERFGNAKLDGFLHKPFQPGALRRALAEALNR